MRSVDVVVVGGGIAGVSVAARLPRELRVVVVERESSLVHHSTGRSAAVLVPGLGGGVFSALTDVGLETLDNPDSEFSEVSFLSPRGLLTANVAGDDVEPPSEDISNSRLGQVERVGFDVVVEMAPWVDLDSVESVTFQPDVSDLEVAGLHQAYVREARRNSVDIVRECEVVELARTGTTWRVTTSTEEYETPVVVNAAGAWGDVVAGRAGVSPVGLIPKRRTAFTVPTPGVFDGPMLISSRDDFYAKPEAGEQLLLSPMDQTPVEPSDVRHEEIDVAMTIEAAQPFVRNELRSVRTAWAGLRVFTPDQNPVIGWSEHDGFFWLCGQGGTGIQSAPGAADCAVGLIIDGVVPGRHLEAGLDPAAIDPLRFQNGRDGGRLQG